MTAAYRSDPVHRSLRFELFPGVVQIKKHDHSSLSIKAGKSDQANLDRDAHVVMEEVQHQELKNAPTNEKGARLCSKVRSEVRWDTTGWAAAGDPDD